MSSDKPPEQGDEAAIPDIEHLAREAAAIAAAAVPADEEPLAPTTQLPRVTSAAGAQDSTSGVDENAPTDYYHSVKPRPKAVPIAELGTGEGKATQADRTRARNWLWLVAAGALTGALALAGLARHEPRPPSAAARRPAKGTPNAKGGALTTKRRVHAGNERDLRRDDFVDSAKAISRNTAHKPGQPVHVVFERRDGAIVVPARIKGPSGEVVVRLAFDTGATFSTLTTKTLDALGVTLSPVKAQLATANGMVRRALAVVEGIAIQQAEVNGGLTVGVCDACATEETDGLLGLNFARHFLVTVDHELGQLKLVPKAQQDKTADIRPFLQLIRASSQRLGHQVTIRFVVRNTAPRAVQSLLIEAEAPGLQSKPSASIPFLAAQAQRETTIVGSLPGDRGAKTFTLGIAHASW